MRLIGVLLAGIIQVTVLVAQAPESKPTLTASHLLATEKLLHIMGVDDMMKTAVPMLEAAHRQRQLSPEALVAMKDFYAKYLSWADLKDDMIALYTSAFTEADIRKLTSFYESPVGAKLIAFGPRMAAQMTELTQRRMEPHMQELIDIISGKIP